jgi:hypothetical protein
MFVFFIVKIKFHSISEALNNVTGVVKKFTKK